jgi:hypothetical protein
MQSSCFARRILLLILLTSSEQKKTAVEEVAANESERSPRQAFFRAASDELVSSYKDEWDNLMFREGRFMQIGQYIHFNNP